MSTTPNSAHPLRVLIVEDVEDDALLLVDHLQSGGFQTDWQRVDSETSLRAAMKEPWDIVFSDFSMPHFTGGEALDIIREHDPDLPFIFVSGTIGEDAAVRAMKAGAQDYIMKGNMTRLPPVVDRELRDARLRRENRESEQTLRKLSMVVTQAADSVFITDPDGYIEYVNPAFEKLTGFSAEEVTGRTPALLRSDCHGGDKFAELWRTISRGDVYMGTLINRRKNGELFHEEKVITPLKDEQGRITHFVSTSRDITERVHAEKARGQLTAILEATPDLVAILEPDGCLRYLNGAGRRLLGLEDEQELEGRCLKDIVPESMVRKLQTDVIPAVRQNGVWSGETTLQIAGDGYLPVSQVVLAHHDDEGQIEYLSTIARDISERKRFEAELQHRATHDSLTGLPNRFLLADRFSTLLDDARRRGRNVAVLFLDMDNFKRVNDSLSHAAGDALLKQVARRLKSCLRPNDTVARHGGDEFTLVLGDVARAESVLVVLNKLRRAFERPVIIGTHELYVTFSVGIALFPDDGEQVEDLLRHADTAMYRAKASGSSQYRFYSPEMNARGHEFLALEADLQRALEYREFLLRFQPQIDLRSGRITGAEALIRWQHPKRGLVSPGDFIPLLENSGLIIPVGEWVLREACRTHRCWRESGHNPVRISVNVSAAQFNDENLLEKVQTALEEEAMPRHALELEITENIVMQDPQSAAKILQALHSMGVRTAIDDFGTGYSSLAYLKSFPLNVLKIDQTFVGDLGTDSGDTAIVEASISLARKLGLETVAEGVETRDQLQFLQSRNCDMVQGYYFSRPLEEKQAAALMEKTWRW